MLAIYNREFVCEPARHVLNRMHQECEGDERSKYEVLRQEYQKVKNGYVAFLERYGDFARDLNRAFAENIARDYYERPAEL